VFLAARGYGDDDRWVVHVLSFQSVCGLGIAGGRSCHRPEVLRIAKSRAAPGGGMYAALGGITFGGGRVTNGAAVFLFLMGITSDVEYCKFLVYAVPRKGVIKLNPFEGAPNENELAHELAMLWLSKQDLSSLKPGEVKEMYAKAFQEIRDKNVERW
jgi:hypothetical protein